jgi:hypothetical protein
MVLRPAPGSRKRSDIRAEKRPCTKIGRCPTARRRAAPAHLHEVGSGPATSITRRVTPAPGGYCRRIPWIGSSMRFATTPRAQIPGDRLASPDSMLSAAMAQLALDLPASTVIRSPGSIGDKRNQRGRPAAAGRRARETGSAVPLNPRTLHLPSGRAVAHVEVGPPAGRRRCRSRQPGRQQHQLHCPAVIRHIQPVTHVQAVAVIGSGRPSGHSLTGKDLLELARPSCSSSCWRWPAGRSVLIGPHQVVGSGQRRRRGVRRVGRGLAERRVAGAEGAIYLPVETQETSSPTARAAFNSSWVPIRLV